MNVAVLGLGAMGSRMAHNLLKAGHAVTVYNRSPEPALALEREGATRASTPRAAATGADVVMSMVADDTAARAVWLDAEHGAVHGLGAGSIAIESSTVTPAWVQELNAEVSSRGAAFLDAPVVGSRPQAEAGQLIYLVGGDEATFERAKPVFQTSCGFIHHVGPVGQGMALKLAVNALFGIQVAAVAELLGLLQKSGVPEARAAAILNELPVTSPAVKGALASMVGRHFAPLFPIDLVEKDFRYALETAREVGSSVPTTQAVHDVYVKAQRAGGGADHITGIAKTFLAI
jgi:3-hydroxyisobutyrate dehydrogenase-like beta-hydroxyacid dehydrogenase